MPINAQLPVLNRRLFRLRNILLIVMLMVLGLPLGGLYFFRIYENELVQQTERELISQSAVLSASFRQHVRNFDHQNNTYGKMLPSLPLPESSSYEPVMPVLNLINQLEPPRPEAQAAQIPADEVAQQVGALMHQVMLDSQHVTLSGIRLLDMNGTVIAGRNEVGLSLAGIPEVRRALEGHYAGAIRQRISDEPPPPLYSMSRGTNIRVFVAFPVLENRHLQGVIYLSRTPDNILKHLFAVRKKVFVAFICLLGLVVALVLLVSATISRPIRELIEQTERVKQGEQKLLEPLSNPVTYEIAQLSESFAGMSQALAERSDYIRRFAGHVSHEFKTPLTSMQGALELLQDHLDTMPVEQRQRFIGNILADTQRLRQLVNRLLELARADALEPSRLHSDLHAVLDGLANRYLERGLQLHFTGLPDTTLAIAPDALEMVLINLFENSLQHAATQLEISAGFYENTLQLNLHDNGAGVSAANRNKIFTPFFTTRRNAGGTGLGLEITLSLLKAYGGKIELAESRQGALFVLSLPLSRLKNQSTA
ncbi:sensor histidine kinase [Candidatus Methylobacter oryzae]|uniref:histidine kinase n=1 Tax=Candidatus Methylobacter oryzae TaxID=2497749 RepID=A0ABY3CA49_9GAMM|nr:HAMP domain-containing sensor histidine kinase [Candidatus Methylobacter oryzae]TRW94360.1 HAMP domain-containing histidine kinase [Candidatus Methylobacter oryzae]